MPQARNPARGAGFFTVIDGQAGVGKTTVIALIAARLAAMERVRGPDHPSTLASRDSLAAAYQDAGRTEEARNYDL